MSHRSSHTAEYSMHKCIADVTDVYPMHIELTNCNCVTANNAQCDHENKYTV